MVGTIIRSGDGWMCFLQILYRSVCLSVLLPEEEDKLTCDLSPCSHFVVIQQKQQFQPERLSNITCGHFFMFFVLLCKDQMVISYISFESIDKYSRLIAGYAVVLPIMETIDICKYWKIHIGSIQSTRQKPNPVLDIPFFSDSCLCITQNRCIKIFSEILRFQF